MPKGVTWIRDAATGFDPDNNTVHLGRSGDVRYDVLVVCPGIQLDWDKIPGVTDTLGRNGVSSNYTVDLAPKTWDFIRNTRSGTAVFAMPSGPIKCAGSSSPAMRLPEGGLTGAPRAKQAGERPPTTSNEMRSRIVALLGNRW